jgi:hypothetical protein
LLPNPIEIRNIFPAEGLGRRVHATFRDHLSASPYVLFSQIF